MRKIDPALLRAYITVVETGNLTAAAKLIGRTISAVFYQIQRLETAMGQKLLVRKKGRLVPTKAGDAFLRQAHSLLQAHDQILAGAWSPSASDSSNETQLNKVGTDPSSGAYSSKRVATFEDNLETPFFREIFSIWKSYRGDGKTPSLSELKDSGIIDHSKHKSMHMCFEQSELRCVEASYRPMRMFQLDRYGLGMTFDQLWKSPTICESRRKIFSICRDAEMQRCRCSRIFFWECRHSVAFKSLLYNNRPVCNDAIGSIAITD